MLRGSLSLSEYNLITLTHACPDPEKIDPNQGFPFLTPHFQCERLQISNWIPYLIKHSHYSYLYSCPTHTQCEAPCPDPEKIDWNQNFLFLTTHFHYEWLQIYNQITHSSCDAEKMDNFFYFSSFIYGIRRIFIVSKIFIWIYCKWFTLWLGDAEHRSGLLRIGGL